MGKPMFWVLLLLLVFPMLSSSSSWGCPPQELNALNHFRQELLDPYDSLASWKGSYCFSWKGVACHHLTGHVVRLDLTTSYPLSAVVRNSSSQIFPALFQLHHLEYGLDLSLVDLSPLPFPSHLPMTLTRLTHLSIFACRLTGRIPSDIGNMSSLTVLDISYNYDLEMRQSSSWMRNLRGLEHLALAYVNLTSDVVDNVASLPNLTSLAMSDMAAGPPLSPLANLTSLSHLELDGDYYTQQPFPIWISNLSSLASLYLYEYNLSTSVPSAVFTLPHLTDLHLSENPNLTVNLSFIVQHASQLSRLSISSSNVGGVLPNSIGNMSSLTFLDLSGNNIDGSLPDSMGNMSLLTTLYLYGNHIEGSLPDSMGNMFSLTSLDLSDNHIEGSLPDSMGNMFSLTSLDLYQNSIGGSLPNCLGNLEQLKDLDLYGNSLRGNIPWSSLGRLSKLRILQLGSNQLNGSLPSNFGNFSSLQRLDLSNNSLRGTFLLSQIENLTELNYLSLSQNFLRVTVEDQSWIPKFQLYSLFLSSCNMVGNFPAFISTQYTIEYLDLSNNSLSGDIPDWLWDLEPFSTLNLSCNQFEGRPLSSRFSKFGARNVDLHRNKLQGKIFAPHLDVQFLDMSENQFDGIISETNCKNDQSQLNYLSLANNNITGPFPHYICGGQHLEVLDVSNNKLTGNIFESFENCSSTLEVLNLENNNLEGDIRRMVCLKTLKLGGNKLQGSIPLSFQNCTSLEILDLGYNNLQGTIPHWIGKLISLRILVLRSNKFRGGIPLELTKLQNLQVLILSDNNLSGTIPRSLRNLRAMENQTDGTNFLLQEANSSSTPYLDKMVINNKGLFLEYVRSLAWVRCLDLSSNNFSGDIPPAIGFLIGLRILNLSRNHLSGKIPTSFGKLVQLESLDLSDNNLIGSIPGELQSLTFLGYLNMSFNNFSGRIPQGAQWLTFGERSFSNNGNLCGLQININCSSTPSNNIHNEDASEWEWEERLWWEIGIGLSFGFGFFIVVAVLCFNKKCRTKCFNIVDDIIVILDQTIQKKIFP